MALEKPKCKCVVCGSEELGPLYEAPRLSIRKCAECGLVFNAIAVEPGFDPASQYSSDYYDERPDYYEETGAPSKEKQEALDSFGVGLDLLEKHQPARGRLIDVGCGYGSFLAFAKERGWEALGVDISEHAAAVASKKAGVEVKTGALDKAGFEDATFDAVALNDSLEHFADPNEQLRQIARILKPGGSLFLNTPNQDALLRVVAHAIYRLSAGAVSYPVRKLYHEFHLFYYSEETLKRLLENNGLEIVELTRKPIPFVKARGNYVERLIVRAFSMIEGLLGREFEILAIAEKKKS